MAQLNILRYPDPRLHTVARPVEQVDARIRRLVDDMLETMYAAEGVGLAATQVDVHERVIVMDTSEGRDQPRVLINPELIARSAEMALGESTNQEPSLSLMERRAFMRLPLAERRRIMQAQAEKLLDIYQHDPERREWQGGDIVEQ